MKLLLSLDDLQGIAPATEAKLREALQSAKPTTNSRKALEGKAVVAIEYGIEGRAYSGDQITEILKGALIPEQLPPPSERLVLMSVTCSRCWVQIDPEEKAQVHAYVKSAMQLKEVTNQ